MAIEYESKKEKFNTEEGDTMKLPAEFRSNISIMAGSVFQVCLRRMLQLRFFIVSKVLSALLDIVK